MIYTVTLNPALDRTLRVKELLKDDTTRVLSEEFYAGGKGIDVSRVIRTLGGQSVAMGLVGGYDGMHLEGLLINSGVTTDFTKISGETRTNIIINEEETDRQYMISARGPEISAVEIGQFYQKVVQTQAMDYLILSGSLPKGVTHNLYGQLILAGKERGAFVVLDADGTALKESISFRPDCIKPNQHELSRLADREVATEEEILDACTHVHSQGVPYVLVSRGAKGMVLSSEELRVKAVGPAVKVDSTVGAGDSTVAGFVLGLSRGWELRECVRLACAAGTATAQTPGTELCHKEDVDRIWPLVEISDL